MSRGVCFNRWIFCFAAVVLWLGRDLKAGAVATMPATTQIGATTQDSPHGPDTVILRELAALYQPVPFDHKTHAQMAEMWDGCTTCHHRSPSTQPPSAPAAVLALDHHDQHQASKIPACKSCHEVSAAESVDFRMPTLKGAYHRQCLNCHRDWANENSCTACHKPVDGVATKEQPTADDIVGRMHPPMPEPDVKIYKARFLPAVGANVTFRHKEHSTKYGLKCVNCHRHDNCSSCHSAKPQAAGPHLLKPGRTWRDTHGPCVGCHQDDRCNTCHYGDDQTPPPPFEHRMTKQILDKDHIELKCAQCHIRVKAKTELTCGDSSCHKPEQAIAFPAYRPGPVVLAPATTTAPSTKPVVEVKSGPTGTIKRVRRANAE